MATIAKTPEPPYYAVIFTSLQTSSLEGYDDMAERMAALAQEQPGFLGYESARDAQSGLGITVSYWRDEESIRNWKANVEHRVAQKRGYTEWYAQFATRFCRVERTNMFERPRSD